MNQLNIEDAMTAFEPIIKKYPQLQISIAVGGECDGLKACFMILDNGSFINVNKGEEDSYTVESKAKEFGLMCEIAKTQIVRSNYETARMFGMDSVMAADWSNARFNNYKHD